MVIEANIPFVICPELSEHQESDLRCKKSVHQPENSWILDDSHSDNDLFTDVSDAVV